MEKAPDIRFGTDGWRGIIARDFTFENVRRVSQAIADALRDEDMKDKKTSLKGPVIIGYDRRFASDAFAREIARIMQGNNLSTVLASESLPTPAISLLTSKLKGLGIMVTASHNPPSYNGIKIKRDGRAALENQTAAIESWIDKSPAARGSGFKEKSFRDDYLNYLKARIDLPKIKSRLKRPIVIDYMFGASAGLAEELLPKKKLVTIHSRRDPLFGGVNPEPIEANLKELKERVLSEKALIGIAFDGDGDRVGVIDDLGRYYSPCRVFPILINYLVESKKIRGKIVQSVSMGYLAERLAKNYGLEFEEMPVGFKHVAAALAEGSAVIAGEESGGYAWKGGLPERDGLLAALTLIEICVKTGKKPSELWKAIESKYGNSCFKRIDYHVHRAIPDKAVFAAKLIKRLPKKILGEPIKKTIDIDGLKIILASDHWLLMRPSGTEPLMRVYAESDSDKKTAELLELAKKWAAPSA
jgi:phosphomannomutase